MKEVFLRSSFNYDRDAVSLEAAFRQDPDEECFVQQQHKDECDINTIIERFGLAGVVPENFRAPMQGDFTGVTDFQSAVNLVQESREAFMALPGALRAEFGHDPGRLLMFLADEKNREKAVELGLVPKPPEKTRDAVQAIDELAAVLKPKVS